ncbi:MAG: Loki-CTERM sorting domain-containing protein [Candidatus Hermodarchaeota archaeon]
MKFHKFFLIVLIFWLLFPICYALSVERDFKFEDRVNEGASRFFMVDLEEDDELEVELDAREDGFFHIFLFDERPEEDHVNYDKTIDDDIYKEDITHDKGKHPDINYTAEDDQIYYIQVILEKNGPDSYKLEANTKLTRYYLPQIPGYQIELLLLTVGLSIGIIVFLVKKKHLCISK